MIYLAYAIMLFSVIVLILSIRELWRCMCRRMT